MKTEGVEKGLKEVQGIIRGFFPYPSFRPFQIEAINFSFEVISDGKIGLLSSPCGTGKSISTLSAYFAARNINSSLGRLLILTRTKNQLEIYSRELKNIREICKVEFTASIFKSKREMCPHALEDQKLREISYRDFLQYCKGLKSGFFGESCKYYNITYSDGGWKPSRLAQDTVKKIRKIGPLMPEETYKLCRHMGLCPYEVARILTRRADIIVGNYNYVLLEAVRGSTLGRAGVRIKNVNCIFDEAHSLPYYASGILSDEISQKSIKRAIKEIERFGLNGYVILEALYNSLIKFGKAVYRAYGPEVEHIIAKQGLVNAITEKTGIDTDGLPEIFEELMVTGEIIRQRRIEAGKSPVSYLSRCAAFLIDWINLNDQEYARYIRVEESAEGKKNVKLGIKCLDPSLATNVINEMRSAILMSGTLWNMDYYIDMLGLDKSRCKSLELPNPFPPENRLILVDMAVTTKFEERNETQWIRMAEHITRVIQAVKGRVAVYFPSYDVMRGVMSHVKLSIPTIIEDKNTRITDVLDFLKDNNQCALFGVARGKISEGVDMSIGGHSMLSAVIIAGLPYPKRTELHEALQEYFEKKFGDKAVECVNNIPCLNALAQSVGRLLRSPEDKGIIILMDRRAVGKFKQKLPEDWKREMKVHAKMEKIINRIDVFMKSGFQKISV